jgi:hypothetical protein
MDFVHIFSIFNIDNTRIGRVDICGYVVGLVDSGVVLVGYGVGYVDIGVDSRPDTALYIINKIQKNNTIARVKCWSKWS